MKQITKLTIYSTFFILASSIATNIIIDKTSNKKIVIEEETTTKLENTPIPTPTPIIPSPTPSPTIDEVFLIEEENIEINNQEEDLRELVILTFDDGPSKYTVELLDLLDEYEIKATFFVLKCNCVNYPDSLIEIASRGHEIAIHGATHTSFKKLTDEEIEKEITETIEYINSLGIDASKIVRAPGGNVNERVKEALNYPLVHWNIDTQDWKTHDSTSIKEEITSNIKEGSIILMHDTAAVYKCDTAALNDILPELVQEYHFVTVSEYCTLKSITLEEGKVYRKIK